MAPQLHNLVPYEDKDQCWINNIITTRKNKRSHIGVSEDKKLELRLGLPGDIDHHHEDKKALLFQADDSFKSISSTPKEERNWLANGSFVGSSVPSLAFHQKQKNDKPKPSYLPFSSSSIPSDQNKKKCSDDLHGITDHNSKFSNSSAPNCCDKRTGRAPVVGWPPVRSFRKNLGSNSFSKAPIGNFESDQKKPPKNQGIKTENGIKSDNQDHIFVKINMEGVPIGRKVDLKAYDSYEKLSYAIDELFRGLLAAQRDYSASESTEETGDAKRVTNGEYTLVYEDDEGDRMLVGDVPWKMFVSTAKRLRVLRTIEISTLKLNTSNQIEKTPLESTMGMGE